MAKRGYFDHVNSKGQDAVDRIEDERYKWIAVGENIYLGPDDALSLMKGWLASSGHCRNILAQQYRDFGFGIAQNRGRTYSTQVFATEPSDKRPSQKGGPQRSCPEKLRYKG